MTNNWTWVQSLPLPLTLRLCRQLHLSVVVISEEESSRTQPEETHCPRWQCLCPSLMQWHIPCDSERAVTHSDCARVSAASLHRCAHITRRQAAAGLRLPSAPAVAVHSWASVPPPAPGKPPTTTSPILFYQRCNAGIHGERERRGGMDTFAFITQEKAQV